MGDGIAWNLAGVSAPPGTLQISAAHIGEIAMTNRKLKLLRARAGELEAALAAAEKPPASD